jgi:hypothetical protein
VAPKSAINHHGARKDFCALVKKYVPLAGAGNALSFEQLSEQGGGYLTKTKYMIEGQRALDEVGKS